MLIKSDKPPAPPTKSRALSVISTSERLSAIFVIPTGEVVFVAVDVTNQGESVESALAKLGHLSRAGQSARGNLSASFV